MSSPSSAGLNKCEWATMRIVRVSTPLPLVALRKANSRVATDRWTRNPASTEPDGFSFHRQLWGRLQVPTARATLPNAADSQENGCKLHWHMSVNTWPYARPVCAHFPALWPSHAFIDKFTALRYDSVAALNQSWVGLHSCGRMTRNQRGSNVRPMTIRHIFFSFFLENFLSLSLGYEVLSPGHNRKSTGCKTFEIQNSREIGQLNPGHQILENCNRSCATNMIWNINARAWTGILINPKVKKDLEFVTSKCFN